MSLIKLAEKRSMIPPFSWLFQNLNCFIFSINSQEIRLEFDKWSLEAPCSKANVTVYNGPIALPEDLIGTFCGDTGVMPVGTTKSSLLLVFRSSSYGGGYKGFRARFKGRNVTGGFWNFIISKLCVPPRNFDSKRECVPSLHLFHDANMNHYNPKKVIISCI